MHPSLCYNSLTLHLLARNRATSGATRQLIAKVTDVTQVPVVAA